MQLKLIFTAKVSHFASIPKPTRSEVLLACLLAPRILTISLKFLYFSQRTIYHFESDTQLILKPCHPKWNSSSYSHKLIACIWEALVFIGYFRSVWCKIRSVLSRNVLWDCLRRRLAIKKSRGKLGPNSSPKTVPQCNSPLKKRERNWAELTVAKTFGTVSGGN